MFAAYTANSNYTMAPRSKESEQANITRNCSLCKAVVQMRIRKLKHNCCFFPEYTISLYNPYSNIHTHMWAAQHEHMLDVVT